MFKKSIAVLLLAASLGVATPARATLGLVTFNPTLVVVGAVLTLAGSGTFVGFWRGRPGVRLVVGPVGLVGLILLDGQNEAPSAEFTAVNKAQAAKLAMTASEELAYNAELPEINAVKEDLIAQGVRALESGQVTESGIDAFMSQAWINAVHEGQISESAFAGLNKVRAQALN